MVYDVTIVHSYVHSDTNVIKAMSGTIQTLLRISNCWFYCDTRLTMSEELSFSQTQKGKRKACYQGCFFIFGKYSKSKSTLSFWQCEEKRRTIKELKCKGLILIKDGEVTKSQGTHNHAPNGLKKQVLDLRNEIE